MKPSIQIGVCCIFQLQRGIISHSYSCLASSRLEAGLGGTEALAKTKEPGQQGLVQARRFCKARAANGDVWLRLPSNVLPVSDFSRKSAFRLRSHLRGAGGGQVGMNKKQKARRDSAHRSRNAEGAFVWFHKGYGDGRCEDRVLRAQGKMVFA